MTEVIGVRFRGGCKEYYFDPHGITVEDGQFVIVETSQGVEFAQCLSGNHEVEDDTVVQPLRPLLRLASESDKRTVELNRAREQEAFQVCRKKIAEHGLDMKLVRVECNFDASKIVFFFTSDGRVDFRELVRDLAGAFRARIELRQIGVRDEAKMLGGLGICGRPFCCAEFMDDFIPVSIKMAKTQSLSLNPTKISGTCGRLMCCLKYEQAAYEDAAKRMPKNDSFVLTPDGPGNICSVDLVREKVHVRLDDAPESQKCYHACELCVLRNGKGSREGIEIPAERPERWQPPEAAQDVLDLSAYEQISAPGDEPSAGTAKGEGKSRSRGRRRGGRGERKVSAAPNGEQKSGQQSEQKGAAKTEQNAAEHAGPRRARPAAGNAEKKAANAPAQSEGGETKPHRRHHRGGRSHRRHNGGAAPKSEG